MKNTLLLLIFIFLAMAEVSGQYNINQNKVWAFGANAGVDFTSGSPVPFSTAISTLEGCASVSDAGGNLLFYTEGKNVWNKYGALMTHGTSIVSFATFSTSQAALIVPKPGNPNQYYLFSLESVVGTLGYCHLAYSIVDMSLSGGLGDVVADSMGIPLASSLNEQMTAVKGENCDVWVLTHSAIATQFIAYDITTAGIGSPVISTTGSIPPTTNLGVMKASPDRQKIVAQYDGFSYVAGSFSGTELYDFNVNTGIVSNAQTLSTANIQYGAEFSPDNTKLYTQCPLYQYDISLATTAAIIASKTLLSGAFFFDDLKLAPDGKIYMGENNLMYLDCITSPNAAGTACGYSTHTVTLASGTFAKSGLPNIFIYVAPTDTFYTRHDTSVCIPVGGNITLSAHDTATGSAYLWNDGTTATRTYNIIAPGIYWVRIYNRCMLTIDTIHVVSPLIDSVTGIVTLCAGGTTVLSPSVTGGVWSSVGTGVATVSSTGVLTGVLVGTASITYNLSGYCPTSRTVTVNPSPGVITGVLSLCNGATTSVSDGISGGTWSSSSTARATIDGMGTIYGVTAGTAIVTYNVVGGCKAVATVTVNPSPPAITGIAILCSGATTTLNDGATGGSWSGSAGGIATVSGPIVSGVSAGTAIITYTLSTGCAAIIPVTINRTPSPIGGTPALCIGNMAYLNDAVGGGVWSSGNTSIATTDSFGTVSGVSAGLATITYAIGGCIVTATVTVEPLPSPVTGLTTMCVGQATILSDVATGGTWSTASSSVSLDTITGSLTTVAAGIATITYTLPTGCAITKTVSVDTSPGAITGTAQVCAGLTTILVDGGGGTWTSSNTAIATIGSSGLVSGIAAGTTAITYSLGSSCNATAIVSVSPLPSAILGIEVLCAGSTTALGDSSTGSLLTGGTWSSSNTGIATAGSASGIVSGIAGGTAIVTYTASLTGCAAHATVTVNAQPAAITGTLTLCVGATTTLSDHTPGGLWASGNTAIATIGSAGSPSTSIVTGITPGTTMITYTNSATGCATHTTLTINPLPLTITGTSSICAGATTTLLDGTSGGLWAAAPGSVATVGSGSGIVSGVLAGTAVISYAVPTGCTRTAFVTINAIPGITGPTAECVGATITEVTSPASGTWTSSVPSVATVGTAGSVTGVATGTTIITYTSVAGCKAATTITVSLSPGGIIGSSAVCAGDTTTLTDAVGGGVWSSSNTVVATVGSLSSIVTGVAVGTTITTYSLGTGCTITRILTVNAAPAGITGTMSMCIGATTTLADATTGGVWSSRATGTATILLIAIGTGGPGIVTGGAAGIDTIVYTHGGCSVNTTVTVNPTPLAIAGAGDVCAGDSITLTDAVSGGVWGSASSGIAGVNATGNVTGISFGTITVTYSLGAGCAVTKTITVNPISAIIGSLGICLGTTTALSDAPTGGTWSPSGGGIASVNSVGMVTGISAGTSVITYTTAEGCSATVTVTVNLTPSAISGTLHVCAGATTALGNAAGGGVWSSGNTAVATVGSTGIVNGIIPGTTIITYSLGSTGSLPAGCTVTAVVTVDAVPSGITGTMTMCAGATSTLIDVTTGGTWSGGSTVIATVSGTGLVRGISGGTVAVSYGLPTGCATTTMVTINPIPAVITGTTHICAGLTATLSSATTGGSWSSTNTATALADPVLGIIMGVTPGTAVITYAFLYGCSTSTIVTTNAAPSPITGSMAVCIGSTTALSDPSGSGVWSNSATGVATVNSTGIVSSIALGTATISYTLGGCAATAVVTVNSLPGAISSTRVCLGSVETLADLPVGGTWSSSNAGVATIDETEGVLTGVSAGTAGIAYSLGAGCTVMAAVTVDALPGAITGTPEVCLHYTTILVDATGSGVWSSSNTSIAVVTSLGAVSGVSGGPATISYTNTSTGCAATRLVTVVAVPAISGVSDMCAFSSVTAVSDAITGGTWTSTSVTVSSAGVVTPYSAGAASLTYTIPLGCYVTDSFTVHPLPGPVTGISRFCRGATSTLGDTTAGGVWSSNNTTVAPVSTGGMVSGRSAGTATISYELATGCMETETITIDSFPSAGTITGSSGVCAGATTVLSDPAVGGVWSSSNTFASVLTGIVSGVSAGVDTIKYTVSNTCGIASTTKTITTYPLPIVYAVTGGGSYCAGSPGVHIGLSGSNTGINYQLYHGATLSGSVAGTGIAADFGLQTAAGFYTSVATNTSTGCTNNMLGSATVTTTPAVTPAVNIATSTGDTICAGSSVTFTASPLNGGSAPAYQWLVNSTMIPGATGSLYTYTPINGDEVKAILISSAPCATPDTVSDSVLMTVVTPVIPTITINASPGTNIQPGQSDTLTAIISGGGPSPAYQWEINGTPIAGATMASFINSYSSNDTVTCIVSVGGICNTEGTDSVVILVSNVGVKILAQDGPLTIVPNPNNGEFTITGALGPTDEEVSIEITDLPGQSIFKRNVSAPGGKINASVSLSNTLANGIYILRLASAGATGTFRVVVEH